MTLTGMPSRLRRVFRAGRWYYSRLYVIRVHGVGSEECSPALLLLTARPWFLKGCGVLLPRSRDRFPTASSSLRQAKGARVGTFIDLYRDLTFSSAARLCGVFHSRGFNLATLNLIKHEGERTKEVVAKKLLGASLLYAPACWFRVYPARY